MASHQLMVEIVARDGASPEFRRIGQVSRQMGAQIGQAGETSRTAMARLLETMKQGTIDTAVLRQSFNAFAQAARASDRELRALDRTYGATADALRDYADELQRTTTYSSEQAVEAANTFGTLARNYGLTADQIEGLIRVSADLAAVNGISLADAAGRVQAAIRGEAESAEALGLTMNDAATGLAGVAAGMSDAEKAAFRYSRLLEQSAFATGAAAEQAETASGRFTRLVNTLQDAGRGFVEMTGPVGQAVAGLSDMSLEVGAAASGFVGMAPVVRSAVAAVGGLGAAMGPVGLALAAGVAVTGIVALITRTEDYVVAARAAETQTLATIEKIRALAFAGIDLPTLDADIAVITGGMEALASGLGDATAVSDDLIGGLAILENAIRNSADGFDTIAEFTGGWDAQVLALIQSTRAYQLAAADQQITADEVAAVMAELQATYVGVEDAAGAAAAALELSNGIIDRAQETGVNTAAVIEQMSAAYARFASGEIDAAGLLSELTRIESAIAAVDTRAAKTSQTVLDLAAAMTGAWTAAMDPLAGVEAALAGIFASFAPGAYAAQQAINGVTSAADTLAIELEAAYGDPAAQARAIANFHATASAMEILNYELLQAGDNQERISAAYRAFAARVDEAAVGIAALDRAISRTWANGAAIWGQMAAGNVTLDEQRAATEAWGAAWGNAAAGWTLLANAQSATNAATAAGLAANTAQALTDQAAAAYAAAVDVGALDTALEQLAAVGAGQGVEDIGRGIRVNILDVANDATIAINALASGFQVLVQNPINWGKQAQDVADWATSMMLGADGVNSLSDLWGRGQIETITYNRGLEAQGRIQKANADIQNDVARIQAKQLPIMADLIEGQAEYMDKLADLDPLNQTIALGYMDTTKAAQAQNLVMLAGAAAAGEYGAMGTEMATNIITAAAQADPVLKAMLIDMGLISEGADGEIDIKFTRAKSLNDDLQRLIESIDALVVALGGIPAHTNAAVDVAFRVNGTPMLPNQIGQFGFTMATGGTVYAATRTPMYATAATGATTLVGEAGPEMVWLPGGAQVSSSPVTRDRMQRSGAGSEAGGAVNFYGPVTLAPASSDVAAAIRREALAGARG